VDNSNSSVEYQPNSPSTTWALAGALPNSCPMTGADTTSASRFAVVTTPRSRRASRIRYSAPNGTAAQRQFRRIECGIGAGSLYDPADRGLPWTRPMAGCTHIDQIQVYELPESSDGCQDCLAVGGKWLHLRICLNCGHVGCCDDSPN